ncbi:bacteriorhodopsin [Nonomuraea thailandensis]|uniref:Bacteriorhodopsin n=1 Tax=Nonomuraea thailandensis TaxID=1188745 RepID=A0A9X2K3B6_9ACTN|nr:DUF5360 family protein [Nonomuraea thailandensis]MCP2357955.1 bacteriorhodopsin [Nonomuraea thailandensis]
MLPVTKVLMLITDVAFVAYFTVTGLGLIPPEWAFNGYSDPVMADWNWSFLWIDLAASATGLASLHLLRRRSASGPGLMLISLVLTMASGLMAIAFWTLRGDFSPAWWLPNLYLMLFPIPAIVCLARSRPAGIPSEA